MLSANKIRLWNKGVDSESFHPRYRSHEMRLRLRCCTYPLFCSSVLNCSVVMFLLELYIFALYSNSEPDRPLVIHVGRLGVEKSLDFLKRYHLSIA